MCHHKHSVLLKVIIILVVSTSVLAQYSGGSGTAEDPYSIATAADLVLLGETPEDYDKHFIMTADIDLDPNLPGGMVFDRPLVVTFAGELNGDGYCICNMTINRFLARNGILAENKDLGLFGYLAKTAWIKDLSIVHANVAGIGENIGVLAAISSGYIVDCSTNGLVEGEAFDRDSSVGGLVGSNDGRIENCFSSCSVSSKGAYWPFGGGFAGANLKSGIIRECYSDGIVSGDHLIGGFVGSNNKGGLIKDCYSSATVDGNAASTGGGFAGITKGDVANCYSTGLTSGEGFVGVIKGSISGSVSQSFWDVETSGQSSGMGATGLTTSEMQTASTFIEAGWDFANSGGRGRKDIWTIVEGKTYPLLSWQKYGGGTGEPNDPYLIYTAEHLNELGAEPKDYDKHFKLMADIDLSEYVYDRAVIAPDVNDDEDRFQKTRFTGVFDGNEHSILNLTIDGSSFLGLFGRIGQRGVVQNLNLYDAVIKGSGSSIGCLAGSATTISCSWPNPVLVNCSITGQVSGETNVGGLVGWLSYGRGIEECHSSGVIKGTENVGGLVGYNGWGYVDHSSSSANISGTTRVGGLVGSQTCGSIEESFSNGTVIGQDEVGQIVGIDHGCPESGVPCF